MHTEAVRRAASLGIPPRALLTFKIGEPRSFIKIDHSIVEDESFTDPDPTFFNNSPPHPYKKRTIDRFHKQPDSQVVDSIPQCDDYNHSFLPESWAWITHGSLRGCPASNCSGRVREPTVLLRCFEMGCRLRLTILDNIGVLWYFLFCALGLAIICWEKVQ